MRIRLLPPIILLILLLTGCNAPPPIIAPTPPANLETPTATSNEPAAPAPLPLATVTFRVTIPANTPPNQPIQLSLLDEVTGLAINPKRFTMLEDDDFVYLVNVELPVGSVIQYRYTRQANVTAEEHTSDGRPVRYRMFKVDGPAEIHDVITRWNDTTHDFAVGRITGKVTDAVSGQPVPNLMIIVGGAQTLTAWDGTFRVEGLPVGTHNLVAYALDGSYYTFQQGAIVAENATTPAAFSMIPAPFTTVTFHLTVPTDTVLAVPVRIAGNLYQFGNTFANLSGGFSVPASRMPVMAYQTDGTYQLSMQLPVGAFLRYKYTLGDGFWNAERTQSGSVPLREILISAEGMIIHDTVQTWTSVGKAPVWFDVTVPANTPANDSISLQLNPWGWTQPLPMWKLSEHRWVYLLSSPLDVLGNVTYRYCRNDQCGSADDAATVGVTTPGRPLALGADFQTIEDVVDRWQWTLPAGDGSALPPGEDVIPRGEGFWAGVEFQPAYHPTWTPRLPLTFERLQNLGANSVVLAPTWTYTGIRPLSFEVVPSEDMPWLDLSEAILEAHGQSLEVALFPTPLFDSLPGLWWEAAPRDFAWWADWFELYKTFALHHASLASRTGAETLILGGDWLNPAMPNGYMPDGAPSNVPGDALARWQNILADVRAEYNGTIAWALPYPYGVQNPPLFLDQVDMIYLLWSVPLSSSPNATTDELQAEAIRLMDRVIQPFAAVYGKPMVIAVGYPSAEGGITGCVPSTEGGCLPLNMLDRPNADRPDVTLDLNEQWQVYSAFLNIVNTRDWIAGVVSRGYYPPAELADKSLSVQGKPAEQLLEFWFQNWNR